MSGVHTMTMAAMCLIAVGGSVALVGVFLRGIHRMPTRSCRLAPRGGPATGQGLVDGRLE